MAEGSACSGSEANNISKQDLCENFDTDDKEALVDHLGRYYWLLYPRMKTRFAVDRTYELPYKNMYIVCTPLKGKDGPNYISQLYNKLRRLGFERIVITKELYKKGSKDRVFTHYNVLITSSYDFSRFHDSVFYNMCHMHLQYLPTQGDVSPVLRYIFMESQLRQFNINIDYKYYLKA